MHDKKLITKGVAKIADCKIKKEHLLIINKLAYWCLRLKKIVQRFGTTRGMNISTSWIANICMYVALSLAASFYNCKTSLLTDSVLT